MKTLSAPLNVIFGITNRCNLNCRHCLAASTRSAQDFSTDELLGIVRQLADLKVFNVSLFGGEPLLRKDFFTVLEALLGARIAVSLNTNGTVITKDMARRLTRYPIKAYVVSLDGSQPNVQDYFRGKGSFRKNIAGIKNLLEQGCKVMLSVTVHRYNYEDVANIASLARGLGVNRVRFNELMYVGNAACYHSELTLKPRQKHVLIEALRQLKKSYGNFIIGSYIKIIDIMDEIAKGQKTIFPLKIHSCGAAVSQCAIRPDGYLIPCEILWHVEAGDLRKQSLYDIWHTSPVMGALRKDMVISQDEIPECIGCRYLRLCYQGHRCQPYCYPGRHFEHKELYCWREDVCS